jgi:NTE family protein
MSRCVSEMCARSLICNKESRGIAAAVSMTNAMDTRPQRVRNRPPFECVALVLQGGGALGAYQAGVFQALAEAGLEPDWIAGISIGAFNSAIIAGNPPEARVEKLRQFWEAVTEPYVRWHAPFAWPGAAPPADASAAPQPPDFWAFASDLAPVLKADTARGFLNQWSAGRVLFNGTPGFFALRPVTPWFWPGTSMRATSYYDTSELKRTLERLVDFDRINNQPMRLSVGAVNVQTGNFVYFDTTKDRIRPEHIMASGALPPAFAAVEVDGEYYWDGGLVSNTPLRWVVEGRPQQDTLVFQVVFGRHAANSRATWRTSIRGRRKSSIRAVPAHRLRVSPRCSVSVIPFRRCWRNCRPNWRTRRNTPSCGNFPGARSGI